MSDIGDHLIDGYEPPRPEHSKKDMTEPSTSERQTDLGTVVDLVLGDQAIPTGDSPIESFVFWEGLQNAAFKALHRTKVANPGQRFDFSLWSMPLTPEQKKKRFTDHLKSILPGFDVDRAIESLERQLAKMKLNGPDDDHPNPEAKVPIGSDLVKHLFCHAMADFMDDSDTR